MLEWLALFGSLALASRFLFWSPMPLTYAVFPFAVWAALRFGQRETTSAMLMIAVGAVWGLLHRQGPFWHGSEDRQLIFLVLFLGVMAITAFVLSAATTEREHAEAELRHTHDALESRVQERTAELASTNDALKRINSELARRSQELAAKHEEVESFVYVVSHDLRAPLVNLRGFSEELRASCAELERRLGQSGIPDALARDVRRVPHDDIDGSLHYVTASGSKLQRLIDSLLTLSRTGRDDYELERLHVANLVRATLDVLRGSIEQSDARIEGEARRRAPRRQSLGRKSGRHRHDGSRHAAERTQPKDGGMAEDSLTILVIDGFEVLRQTKADRNTRHIPRVVLTTADDPHRTELLL